MKGRSRQSPPLLVLAVLLGLALPGGARGQAHVLFAFVGPPFEISLRDAQGQLVAHLEPGAYVIHVDDREIGHNFRLTGPGFDLATDIYGTAPATWTVTLADGVYTYTCDAHPNEMTRQFAVGNASLPPPLVRTLPSPSVTRLRASVGRSTIALTSSSGRPVRSGAAGLYSIAVRDGAATQNFHLLGPGLDRKTSVPGTGTMTWSVVLRAGVYRFRSDRNAALGGRFTVSGRGSAHHAG